MGWISVHTDTPPTKMFVLVQEIIEDELYPEPILAPDIGWVDELGVWRSRDRRLIRVAGWMFLPPIDALEQTLDFARKGYNDA